MNRDRLTASIKQHEGFRGRPYKCTAGKTTIGYGRNLDDEPLTQVEGEYLLVRRLNKLEADCRMSVPNFRFLSPLRQEVLVEMAYQLGLGGLLKFVKMFNAIGLDDFITASNQMLNSKWAGQTPARANTLADRMRNG
jgi:lysozyme